MSDELNKSKSAKNEDVCSFELYLIEQKTKIAWHKIIIAVAIAISILAIFTFMFFGFFFSPINIFSVIAIGIGAVLFITLIICTTIVISKCLSKKGLPKECCNFNSEKSMLEAYKAIFENNKK